MSPPVNEQSPPIGYLSMLRERWAVVAAAVGLAILSAVLFSKAAEPRYEAEADVLISPVSSDALLGLPVFRDYVFGRSVVTAARQAKSPQVVARARERLGSTASHAEVSALVSATPQEQSNIVTLTGSGSSGAEAARVANAFAGALVAERTERFQASLRELIERLTRRLGAIENRQRSAEAAALSSRLAELRPLVGTSDPTVDLISPAVASSEPAWPRPLLSVLIAAIVGLLLGIGIAIALEVATPFVTRAESVVDRDGPPILARIARLTPRDVQTAAVDPRALPIDLRQSIRALWSRLPARMTADSAAPTIIITSAGTGEGSAGVAMVLAASMSLSGMRVTLIEANLQRGELARILGPDAPFSTSLHRALLVADDKSLIDAVGERSDVGWRVLLSQPEDRGLTEWVPPDRLAELVVHLKASVDAIVVSVPPLPAAEALVLTQVADATVITVALGTTRRQELGRLRRALAERSVTPWGYVVLGRRRSLRARLRSLYPRPADDREQWTPEPQPGTR